MNGSESEIERSRNLKLRHRIFCRSILVNRSFNALTGLDCLSCWTQFNYASILWHARIRRNNDVQPENSCYLIKLLINANSLLLPQRVTLHEANERGRCLIGKKSHCKGLKHDFRSLTFCFLSRPCIIGHSVRKWVRFLPYVYIVIFDTYFFYRSCFLLYTNFPLQA